jgi:hypothetical protein
MAGIGCGVELRASQQGIWLEPLQQAISQAPAPPAITFADGQAEAACNGANGVKATSRLIKMTAKCFTNSSLPSPKNRPMANFFLAQPPGNSPHPLKIVGTAAALVTDPSRSTPVVGMVGSAVPERQRGPKNQTNEQPRKPYAHKSPYAYKQSFPGARSATHSNICQSKDRNLSGNRCIRWWGGGPARPHEPQT